MSASKLMMLPLLGLSLVAATAVVYIVYQCFFSPLAKVPGPFIPKLTKFYRAYLVLGGQAHREYVALHQKYGKSCGLHRTKCEFEIMSRFPSRQCPKPNAYDLRSHAKPGNRSVADPVAFKEMYKAGNKFVKAESYTVLKGSRPFDLVGERNEKVHSAQRKLVSRAYSMEAMMKLESFMDDMTRDLLERLDESKSDSIDTGRWLQLYAFDVIGSISFSRPFGFVRSGDDGGLFSRITGSIASFAWLLHVPWFFRLHQRLMPIIGNWLAANERHGYFYEFASEEVAKRTDRGGDGKDMVSQLFSVQKGHPEFTDAHIAFSMTDNVNAGSDTTSGALSATIYLLLSNPETMRRLRQELDERKQAGELSDLVTSAEAKQCTYLQAVLYESLRLLPPFGTLLDREVPAGGMTIGPHYIPAGAVVSSTAWTIHRMPEIWGPDFEEFHPERWLDKENEGQLKRIFFAFGGGSRTCIGRNISWLEMEKLLATLLTHYDIQLAPDARVTEESNILVALKGLKVHLSPRPGVGPGLGQTSHGPQPAVSGLVHRS